MKCKGNFFLKINMRGLTFGLRFCASTTRYTHAGTPQIKFQYLLIIFFNIFRIEIVNGAYPRGKNHGNNKVRVVTVTSGRHLLNSHFRRIANMQSHAVAKLEGHTPPSPPFPLAKCSEGSNFYYYHFVVSICGNTSSSSSKLLFRSRAHLYLVVTLLHFPGIRELYFEH